MGYKKVLFILLCITATYCSIPEIYRCFVQKYKGYDFNKYEGYGVFHRGEDRNGNALVYISKTLNNDTFINSGNVIISIDSLEQIVFVDSSEFKFDLNIDTIKNVAMFFNSLNIFSFSVDYKGNAYFSISSFDSPDLIKVNKKSPPEQFKTNEWIELDSGWYLKK